MMRDRKAATTCSRCRKLEEENSKLRGRIAELEGENARLKKDSRTSSKPPSSDIVKKKGKTDRPEGEKRRRGGQPGHPRHERKPFDPSEIDETLAYELDRCPCCGGPVEIRLDQTRVLQQVEIVERPIRIHEHRSVACWCPQCQKTHYAPIPEDIRKAGLAGPRLTALVAFLKYGCHGSYSKIRKFLRDVVGVRISRAQLRNLCAKVSDSLKECYEELVDRLAHEPVLNVDETGHKENGERFWTWCFRASGFTVFRIDQSRGSEVLIDVLGRDFEGVLGCDYFSAYRKYMKLNGHVLVQFCLAHFIRDVKFLAEHPDAANRSYGERLIELLRELFGIIHRREEYGTERGFRRALEKVKGELVWAATLEAPETREASNLAERFFQHTQAYFQFITTPEIDPTNNVAEQAIRFVAIHRRLTQGTRSEPGRQWCERLLTVLVTCEQQSRSAFLFLHETVKAFFSGRPTPSLIPDT